MIFPDQTPLMVFFSLSLIVGIFALLRPVYYNQVEVPCGRLLFAIIFIFLFCIFSFWDTDWFHYQELFYQLKQNSAAESHMEDIYVFLIRNICPNYFIFRIAVWWSALLFFFITIKQVTIDLSLSCFFFGGLFLPFFSYARVSLSIAMMIYGAIIFVKPYNHYFYFSKILGVALIFTSLLFHKSAPISLIVLFFSFISRPTNKNSWFYIAIFFIIGTILMMFIVNNYLSGAMSDESEHIAGQGYLSRSKVEHGVGSVVAILTERIPYYLIAVICYCLQNNYHLPKCIGLMAKYNMYLVIFSTFFAFDLGANTSMLFGRTLRFCLVPSVIILCYCFKYNLFTRLCRSTYIIALFGTFYRISYSLYISAVT